MQDKADCRSEQRTRRSSPYPNGEDEPPDEEYGDEGDLDSDPGHEPALGAAKVHQVALRGLAAFLELGQRQLQTAERSQRRGLRNEGAKNKEQHSHAAEHRSKRERSETTGEQD